MPPLPLKAVRLTDAFWSRWQDVLRTTTLPAEYEQIKKTGRLQNFINAARGEGEFQGLFFNDSDVYKWVEACAYSLTQQDDPNIRAMMDEAIDAIVKAQEPDGYLNTFFQLKHPDLKWRNLGTMHEMYCAGHLIEAGVAHFQATGERKLIDVAMKFADHIMDIFGPEKRRGYCGHQEIELALVRLAKATGEKKYADFALWMIEQRGQRPSVFEEELNDQEAMKLSPWAPAMLKEDGHYTGEYAQDHRPIREQTDVVGHAVRAMYFYAAAATFAKDDPALRDALERIWNTLTTRRMYITGGIGPSAKNEGFTADYDLPNLTAYAETCAAIGLAMWGRYMLELTGDSEYADIIERAIYNGAISGISLSGDHFFYTNPLESRGNHERVSWFNCACCPPNIARLLGSLADYCYSTREGGLFIHIPAGAEGSFVVSGVKVAFKILSKYPFGGAFEVHIDPERPAEFTMGIRIPGWCDDCSTELSGATEEAGYENGYAIFNRTWKKGDVLKVDYNMEPKWIESDPRVLDNAGRVALTHGPLVYCLEEHELKAAPQRFAVERDYEPEVQFEAELLEGVNTITVEGSVLAGDFAGQLYAQEGNQQEIPRAAKLIPYFAWCNRGPSHMQVWLAKR